MTPKTEALACTALTTGRRKLTFAGVLLLYLTILLPTHSMGQDSPTPLVLSNISSPPLTTLEGDGYLDRLYAEWFARAGLSVQLVRIPAARGLQNANAGLIDGDAVRINMDTSAYPNLLRIPEPLLQVVFAGLHLDSNVSIKTADEFGKYRVGYVRGWRIAERIVAGSRNSVAVRNIEGLLDMLAAKRLDVVFITLAPAQRLARELELPTLQSTEFKIKNDVYLYLHSDHRDKIPRLTQILRTMKSDGSYDLIMNDYVNENR